MGTSTRFLRSILASKATFPDGARTVIVANGDNPVGPIVAATMAAARNAPLLYATPQSLSASLSTELRRLAPEVIVLVGSDADVSSTLRSALSAIAPVERVLLTSRYQGSRVALDGIEGIDTVYVTGGNLNHLAVASATASVTGQAALAVNGATSAAAAITIDALRLTGASRLVLVGDSSAISSSYAKSLQAAGFKVSRLTAADEYALSRTMMSQAGSQHSRVYVANPKIAWDVATATALAGVTRQPVVYTPYQCMMSETSSAISRAGARVVAVANSRWLRDPVVKNVACNIEKPRLAIELASKIRNTAAKYTGTFSVSVREIGRVGERVEVGATASLEPASMIKLFAAWAALRRLQGGIATSQTKPGPVTLGTCLKVMIHASDNFCHTDTVHWIGISKLNNLFQSYGFTGTRYGNVSPGTSMLYAGNRSTTRDLTRFMVMLEDGQLLNEKYTAVLQGYMRSQIWTSRIASGIPPGIIQESKPGSLWLSGRLLQADTAIVRGPLATYAVSIIGSPGAGKAGLRALSRVVYTHFNGSFVTSASYPVKQMIAIDRVGVRATAGGAVTGHIGKGTLIEVTDARRHWYQIRYGTRQMWVDSRLLRNR
ncbi:serine hydrolase (plasmid) [Coraliomargarita sp. W4R53]